MTRWAALAAVLGAVTLPAACLGARNTETIVGDLMQRRNLETLVEAVEAANLTSTLDTAGPINYTVFAPVDVAFEALGDLVPTLLNRTNDYNMELLRGLLLSHVVEGQIMSDDLEGLVNGSTLALSGEELMFDLSGDEFTVNGAAIKTKRDTTDVEVINGVIHLIESVLIPLGFPTVSLLELIGQQNLTTFQFVLEELGLIEYLATDDDVAYTVFAPTEAAFEAFIDQYDISVDILFNDTSLLEIIDGIAGAHVVEGHGLLSADITAMSELPTLSGGVPVSLIMPEEIDMLALDGVLHIVSKVIVPNDLQESLSQRIAEIDAERRSSQPTVSGMLVQENDLSALGTALLAANLDVVASDPSARITVFAPVDSAFAVDPVAFMVPFLFGDTDYQRGLLRDILLFHILSEEKMAADLMPTETSLSGDELEFSGLDGDSPTVNGVSITGPDQTTANGIIHVIESVLLPPGAPTETLWGKLEAAGDQVSIMRDLLESSGRRPLLESATAVPFTIFAPTNDAFDDFLGDLNVTLGQLVSDPKAFDLLSDLLEAHIVTEEVLFFDSDITNITGRIKALNGMIEYEDDLATAVATSSKADGALNGAMHILAVVIVPRITGIRLERRIGELRG